MTTTKAQPGEWYLVDGKPFQVPFVDRLGTAIKEGDEVLYPFGALLREGRIISFDAAHQDALIRDLECPEDEWYRLTSSLVLKP